MTNPFKGTSDTTSLFKAAAGADLARIGAEVVAGVGVRAQFESVGAFAAYQNLSIFNHGVSDSLMRAGLVGQYASGAFNSIAVSPFQESVAEVIPSFMDTWRDLPVSTVSATDPPPSIVAAASSIDLGIKEAIGYNALVPTFMNGMAKSAVHVSASAGAWGRFQGEVGSALSAISTNTGVGMVATAAMAGGFGDTKIRDAWRTLIPQVDQMPDIRGIAQFVEETEVDLDYLEFLEEQFEDDPTRREAFRLAVRSIRDRYKIPTKVSKKIVYVVIWVAWVSTVLVARKYLPEDESEMLSEALMASGFAANNVASATRDWIYRNNADE